MLIWHIRIRLQFASASSKRMHRGNRIFRYGTRVSRYLFHVSRCKRVDVLEDNVILFRGKEVLNVRLRFFGPERNDFVTIVS